MAGLNGNCPLTSPTIVGSAVRTKFGQSCSASLSGLICFVGLECPSMVASSWLIDLQFEQNMGIRTELRGKWNRIRPAIEPVAAGLLGSAGLAPAKCDRVFQPQPRQYAAAGLDTKD